MYRGVIEEATPTVIFGWVVNDDDLDEQVKIDVFLDKIFLSTLTAGNFRQDLFDAGLGNGRHGFMLRLPPGEVLAVGSEVSAAVRHHNILLEGSPRSVVDRNLDVVLPESRPEFEGHVDRCDDEAISGWCRNIHNSRHKLVLELLIDGTFHSSFCADKPRDDLRSADVGDGSHAFWISTPLNLLDGRHHQVIVRVANQSYILNNGVKSFKSTAPVALRHLVAMRSVINSTSSFFQNINKIGNISENISSLTRSVVSEGKYAEWASCYNLLSSEDRRAMMEQVGTFAYQPKMSIITPVYNSPVEYLDQLYQSIKSQIYTRWEWAICDDASTSTDTINYLNAIAGSDDRVKLHVNSKNLNISDSTNRAIEACSGDYCIFVDHDDIVAHDALFQNVRMLNEKKYKIIYSDEDKLDEDGFFHSPHFKPDFNYTLLLSYNYFCHLTCMSKALIDEIGGLRSEFNGAQDYDLVLRAVEAVDLDEIGHIPLVLYHWRSHAASTASSMSAKNYAVEAGQKAIQAHLDRTAKDALATDHHPYGYRVQWPLPTDLPLVSIVIPTRDRADLLSMCLSGLLYRTDYRNIEIVIVDNGSEEDATFRLFDELGSDSRVNIVRHEAPFNYSELTNLGVSRSSGELLLLLNNDIEVIEPSWLEEMVTQIARDGVGAVGAKLLYPDGRVQHAGVTLGIGGVAGHSHKLVSKDDGGYMGRACLAQEVSACTAACLLVERSVYESVGGLDAESLGVAFNDVDLCLKITQAGYKIIYTPFAELVHHESVSRGFDDQPHKLIRFHREVAVMLDRWSETLVMDPMHSPNLGLESEQWSVDLNRGVPRLICSSKN